MDYKRIYDSFIADRLHKQPSKPSYFEVHHIHPKALGGDDSKSNLIRLSPEDHLFAHLLLAKIYGGLMWNAVHAMATLGGGDKRIFGARYLFGVARRKSALYHKELFSGPNGPKSDKAKYEIHHFNGEVAIGNRFQLELMSGVTRQQISALLRGEKKSAHGWYSKEFNPRGLTKSEILSEKLSSVEVFNLYHYDGRQWSGTRQDFQIQFGEKLEFSSKRKSVYGWCKTREEANALVEEKKQKALKASASRGDISGINNPMFGVDRRVSKLINVKHKSGEKYQGCSVVFADRLGMRKTDDYQRMIKTLFGKKYVNGSLVKSFKGWSWSD